MILKYLWLFVVILSYLNYVNSFDFRNSGTYSLTLRHSIPALEMLQNELKLLETGTKTRNRRQAVSAAPEFKDSVDVIGKHIIVHRLTGNSIVLKCEPKDFECADEADDLVSSHVDLAKSFTVSGTPTPNITWYKDNVTPIKRTDHGGVLPVTYDKWSLLLNDLVPEDDGNYRCRLCNAFGCVNHVTQLKIKEYLILFPRIKKGYPGNRTALINGSIEMSCPTVNQTHYTIRWIKLLNVDLDLNTTQEEISHKEKYAIRDDTLTINHVTKDDEGWYNCVTNNTVGSDKAAGFLKVVNIQSAADPSKDNEISMWLTPTLSTLLVISMVIVLVICLKLRSERAMKRHAVDTAREVMFEQWMKVVSIETARCNNGYIPTGTLQIPKVTIEKQRLSDVIDKLPHYVQASEYFLPADVQWEINRQYLILSDVLGEGEFGRVLKAEYHGISKANMPSTVAVKMLKDGHSDADMIEFVSEVEIMKMIGKHENIINLLGCCTKDGPFYVVVEYAANGCLRDYLKKYKPNIDVDSKEVLLPLQEREMVDFALQVAKGMEYLASRGCIHRDLAARNVLVSGSRVLKIADFGLARDVRDSDYYRKRTAGKLPVRWMAPESLCHNYYTTKSDVWSFGVLIWEIMTYGDTPYANIPLHYLYNYLRMGKRMERPSNCNEDLYQLMKQCCSFNPDERPTFSELRVKLIENYAIIPTNSSKTLHVKKTFEIQ